MSFLVFSVSLIAMSVVSPAIPPTTSMPPDSATGTAIALTNASNNTTGTFPTVELALILFAALARLATSGNLKSLAGGTLLFVAFRLGRSAVGQRNIGSSTGSGWTLWLRRPKLALRRVVEWADDKLMDARLARISASEGSKKTDMGSMDTKIASSAPVSSGLSAKAVSELLGDSMSTDPPNDSIARALDPRPASAPKKKKKPRDVEPEEVGIERSVSEPGPADRPVEVNSGEYRMALLVRTDLGMGKGKAAAQVSAHFGAWFGCSCNV
jgi:hypothetical protein